MELARIQRRQGANYDERVMPFTRGISLRESSAATHTS